MRNRKFESKRLHRTQLLGRSLKAVLVQFPTNPTGKNRYQNQYQPDSFRSESLGNDTRTYPTKIAQNGPENGRSRPIPTLASNSNCACSSGLGDGGVRNGHQNGHQISTSVKIVLTDSTFSVQATTAVSASFIFRGCVKSHETTIPLNSPGHSQRSLLLR